MHYSLHHIIETICQLQPASRSEMIALFSEALGEHLVKIIDTHNTSSVLFVFARQEQSYVLKAEYGSSTATNREIAWYKRLPNNQHIAPQLHYVYEDARLALLIISYLSKAQTLDELCFQAKITPQEATSIMLEALSRDQTLYETGKRMPLSLAERNSNYLLKYKQRRDEAMHTPFLAELFNASSLTINGKRVRGIDYYISRIQNDATLYDYLTPTEGSTIHGDLHFSNILHVNNFSFLIDPNGKHPLPFEYDLGKLLHSVNGGFGSIMRGDYVLIHDKNEYNLSIRKTEGHAACFAILQERFDTQTLLRGLYSEAMHFATMLSHHAAEKSETTALFLTCVQLFTELFAYLDLSLLKTTRRSQYV